MRIPENNNFGIIRLLLATLVVLGHALILSGPSEGYGIFGYTDFAVDAFFIVSGFLIYASFDKEPVFISFYLRRIFRIYPLYAVVVCLQALAMAWLLGGIRTHLSELFHYLLPNLVMANFLAHDMGGLLSGLHNPGINPSLWTLKVEAGFYLILPLLWLLTRRFGGGFLILLYMASTIFAAAALHYGSISISRQLPGQLRFFAVGIALYRYRNDKRLQFSIPVAAFLSVSIFIICTYLRKDPIMIPVYPLLIGLLVFLCALRLPVIPLKLDISYGVYLMHGPLIQLSLLLGIYEFTPRYVLGLVALVYALALIAERLVERPGIAMGKLLSRAWNNRHPPIRKSL